MRSDEFLKKPALIDYFFYSRYKNSYQSLQWTLDDEKIKDLWFTLDQYVQNFILFYFKWNRQVLFNTKSDDSNVIGYNRIVLMMQLQCFPEIIKYLGVTR